MYQVVFSKAFSKNFKKINNSIGGKKIVQEVKVFLRILAEGDKIPETYRDHQLHGEYVGYRECHIRGDVLLVYKKENNILQITIIDIGSHSYLF